MAIRGDLVKGKVYLIGAGPGDPELLTVKAHRLLSAADVVLHDDLVSPEVVRLAHAAANIENVGKRCGRASLGQAEIHSKMIAFAGQGLQVVRLKGGDPLLFGRCGEEIEALRDAGVDFEVVPGVTAAFGAAAAAGIPLTDRRFASKLVFLTNHRCSGKGLFPAMQPETRIDSADTTVVVYMPGADYRGLAERLVDASFAPGTPCLVVSRATSAQQQILSTTLMGLAHMEVQPAPSIVIVGTVAGSYRKHEGKKAELIEDLLSATSIRVEPQDSLS